MEGHIPLFLPVLPESGAASHPSLILPLEYFLDLTDFLLNLSRYLFSLAFGFQITILGRPSHLLFDRSFDLVKRAF
jgi:hypothetical protein